MVRICLIPMKHLSTIPVCSNALFIYKLDIKDDLVSRFKKEKFNPLLPKPYTGSLIGEDLDILKKYKKLNTEIKKAVDTTLKEILMLRNVNFRIYSSWLTKTEPKGLTQVFGGIHNHSNSWLSGIYYPKGDPGFSVKFFFPSKGQFFTQPIEWNIFNTRNWFINAEDNLLVLFFSQLDHQIMPNESTEERFSLAFNLIPKGKFGTMDSTIIF